VIAMPYRSGSWGPEAKDRSKRRIEYFKTFHQKNYVQNREKILAKDKAKYKLNSEEKKARALAYYYSRREDILTNLKRKRELRLDQERAKVKEYTRKKKNIKKE